jgi:hypothetical protein
MLVSSNSEFLAGLALSGRECQSVFRDLVRQTGEYNLNNIKGDQIDH